MRKLNVQRPAVKRVYGYIRVSTKTQVDSGAGLEAQRRSIQAECEKNGWKLVEIVEDAGISGKNTEKRPGLLRVLEALGEGKAEILMGTKLDRMFRSTIDACNVEARSKGAGWQIYTIDGKADTTTAAGKFQFRIMASAAEYERDVTIERIKAALAVKKSQGVKLGRPKYATTGDAEQLILNMRAEGKTYRAIAEQLNQIGVPTKQGGKCWYPMTIQKILNREQAAA